MNARLLKPLLLAAFAVAGMWGALLIHGSGQTLLASMLVAVLALGLWSYGSPRAQAAPYLYPAIAAALVFVVFPMVYTLGMSFTNQSARNLLDMDRARDQLLEERVVDPSSHRPFLLERHERGWRLFLPSRGAGDAALQVEGLKLDGAAADLPLRPAGDTIGQTAERDLALVVEHLDGLRRLSLQTPEGLHLRVISLREVAHAEPLYVARPDGSLQDRRSAVVYRPDPGEGFFTSEDGQRLQPGFRVGVGLRHYARIFTEPKFREPFLGVFAWTVAFSGLTVLGAGALGLILGCLLNWSALQGRAVYRLILFLPYAVPAFLSILVFKGLFNQNLGEVNLVLEGLFGIRPAWFSDPNLARLMLLIVNIWLGFPYMMVLCSGLIQAIPADLYEASAVVGAGPWQNFRRITLPLIMKPLTPLLISAFAFNFNNFVLISLLTGGRPDHLDSDVPAGTTDILVSYTWRIAFQDSGNQYGLAAAISTVIFLMVALITLAQLRLTRMAEAQKA